MATMSQGSNKKAAAIKSLIAHYADSDDDEMSPDEEEIQEVESKQGSPGEPMSIQGSLKNPMVSNLALASSRSNSPLHLLGTSVNSLKSAATERVQQQESVEEFPFDDEERPTSPVSFNKRLEGLQPDEIVLPHEPKGHCPESVLIKIQKLKEKKEKERMDMVQLIQTRKDIRNPSIYEKLIDLCSIDEFGTNFPSDVYNPREWGPRVLLRSVIWRPEDPND